jgi:hypothetical protein
MDASLLGEQVEARRTQPLPSVEHDRSPCFLGLDCEIDGAVPAALVADGGVEGDHQCSPVSTSSKKTPPHLVHGAGNGSGFALLVTARQLLHIQERLRWRSLRSMVRSGFPRRLMMSRLSIAQIWGSGCRSARPVHFDESVLCQGGFRFLPHTRSQLFAAQLSSRWRLGIMGGSKSQDFGVINEPMKLTGTRN